MSISITTIAGRAATIRYDGPDAAALQAAADGVMDGRNRYDTVSRAMRAGDQIVGAAYAVACGLLTREAALQIGDVHSVNDAGASIPQELVAEYIDTLRDVFAG